MSERTPNQRKKDNETRFRRAGAWLHEANKPLDPSAKFVFSWIAFNAQFTDKSMRKQWENKERKYPLDLMMINEFVNRITHRDSGGMLIDAVSGVKVSLREIFKLPHTFFQFWEKPPTLDITSKSQWHAHFHNEWADRLRDLGDDIKHRNVKRTLNSAFSRLYVVRNQVFHGGHSSSKRTSFGYTQIQHGAEVLVKMTQCFQLIMAERMDKFPEEEWGEVEFRRQGVPDDPDCPPPWLPAAE